MLQRSRFENERFSEGRRLGVLGKKGEASDKSMTWSESGNDNSETDTVMATTLMNHRTSSTTVGDSTAQCFPVQLYGNGDVPTWNCGCAEQYPPPTNDQLMA